MKKFLVLLLSSIFCLIAVPAFSQDIEACKDKCMVEYLEEEAYCAKCFGRKTMNYDECIKSFKEDWELCCEACTIEACKDKCMVEYLEEEAYCAKCFGRKTVNYIDCMDGLKYRWELCVIWCLP